MDTVENVLYFVGEDLQDAVLRAEFVTSNPTAAYEYIENNRLEATYQVFRVMTQTKLGTGRVMKRNQAARTSEVLEEQSFQQDASQSDQRKVGRGTGRVGFGGGFCGGIGAGL